MKTITRTIHVAEDGREFTDKKKCAQYEADGCVLFEPLPNFGDHMLLTDESVNFALWGDGSAYYATATKRSRIPIGSSQRPAWATHIIYFSK